MSRLTEQGYKIPETLGEAIDKIGEVVFREIEGATDDVEDIDVAWIILIDSLEEKEKLMSIKYTPPENPNINDMSLEELLKFKEYLIEKIEKHLPELIDDIDVYIEEKS